MEWKANTRGDFLLTSAVRQEPQEWFPSWLAEPGWNGDREGSVSTIWA